jgi:exopolysaccharide biosynthesis protein YbjH/capsule biosynthesis protein GfcC
VRTPRGRTRIVAALALVLVCPALQGQVAPQRLSDWLRERPRSPDDYPQGLSWRVRAEIPAQRTLQQELLENLSQADLETKADREAANRLRAWLASLPVTGRVPVTLADPYWLEVNPARDPVLEPGDGFVMPRRPRTVTVITEEGERCALPHSPGREALAYLEACRPGSAGRVDRAWLAQPDGRVQRFGVAAWNAEPQDEPAPGAWIWAPGRESWLERFSERVIAFLATQGPAPDPSETASKETPGTVPAGTPAARSRGLEVTASDWGGIGLLQTPSARMAGEGELSANFSRVAPYTRANVFVQPFDWLEAGFRYSDISNRPYGAPELSGTQSAKDKSFDAKLRLWRESAWLPETAVGLRDLTGTGLFAGEYVVASKRYGALDWSAGLGWGYVGGRGNVRNPLRVFGRSFETRSAEVAGEGGSFSTKSYFHGPAAWFGGVQYQTPWRPLILKLEYDGNDYQHEPLANNQRQSSPWNFGIVYRAGRSVDVSLGVERGNTVMLALTLHTDLSGLGTAKTADPPRAPVKTPRPQQPPDWSDTSREIETQTGWAVRGIAQRANELRVEADDAGAVYWRERVDRAVAVLHRDAPASVERFVFAYRQGGVDVAEHVVDRGAWVARQTQPIPPSARRETVLARAPEPAGDAKPLYEKTRPAFESGLGIGYQQTIGGPDAFILYQVYAVERAKLWLGDRTWLQGTVQLGLFDNYDRFRFTASSDLPRVRTFLREYVTTSRLTMPNFQLTHVDRIGANQYASVYAGYLESMFAGAGAEWLYRPFAGKSAIGVDANRVQQRNFRQDFGFDDAGSQTGYRVTTGHATLYWDTGWNNVLATLSAGRYLAGDSGVTVGLSRVFRNGVAVGAFFTKTNVSAARFREGSFDKGLYLAIPFDAFLARSSNSVASFLFRPLTRDGGAKLDRGVALYDITGGRGARTLWYEPAAGAAR